MITRRDPYWDVDQAALNFHSQSAHGAHYFPRMRELLDKIDVEYFDGMVS